jgi:RNA 2',3'-cyclic 3'-phosphodiesterase
MPEEIWRTFIAIELDRPLRNALAKIQEQFKRQMPPGSVRWVEPEGIHLTLKFLGDTARARVGEIEAGLQRACAGFEPFEFTVEGRGCFPNTRRPRVVWVAVRDKGQNLMRLSAAVEREVAPLGWPSEERAFSPHLTLGRVGRGVSGRDEEAVGKAVEASVVEQIGRQRVTGISLIRSELHPNGASYSRLLTVPLVELNQPGA